MSKRDSIFQDDVVFIVLDTFDDAQSGFSFILNPLGIQGDGMVDVNGNMSTSFDAVWYSKGRIDDQGWTVEGRVPLQSIRFPGKKDLTWRVLFVRFFTRTSEQVSFPPLDPNYGSLMGQAQSFGVSGLKHKRVAELIPAATTTVDYGQEQGAMVKTGSTPLSEVPSLTGKLGVTSDLTLDGPTIPTSARSKPTPARSTSTSVIRCIMKRSGRSSSKGATCGSSPAWSRNPRSRPWSIRGRSSIRITAFG